MKMSIKKLLKRVVAAPVYELIKQQKKDDEVILLLNGFLGDNLYSLSVLDELKDALPDKKIVVVASRQNRSIISTYPQISKCIYYGIPETFTARCVRCMTNDDASRLKGLRDGIINTIPALYPEFRNGSGITAREFLAHNILGLPGKKISVPFIQRVPVTAIEDFDALNTNIAVINPYSNSMGFTEELYARFVDILESRGYLVFTNVTGQQEALPGTRPLRCSLQELYSIACKIPLFVSVRSGIVDYLVSSGVNLFVIYELTEKTAHLANYSLRDWPEMGLRCEVTCEKDHILTAERQFCAFLDELEHRTGR